ncbi:hypothetical protein BSLG_007218 [Batrachochytrium salamandrivorans]|nr:hypothetical protein BSLG_007218 [Batrachochytrium salamandrivorans]
MPMQTHSPFSQSFQAPWVREDSRAPIASNRIREPASIINNPFTAQSPHLQFTMDPAHFHQPQTALQHQQPQPISQHSIQFSASHASPNFQPAQLQLQQKHHRESFSHSMPLATSTPVHAALAIPRTTSANLGLTTAALVSQQTIATDSPTTTNLTDQSPVLASAQYPLRQSNPLKRRVPQTQSHVEHTPPVKPTLDDGPLVIDADPPITTIEEVPTASDIKYKRKYVALKLKVRETEKKMYRYTKALEKARHDVARLKLERRVLLQMFLIRDRDRPLYDLDDDNSSRSDQSSEEGTEIGSRRHSNKSQSLFDRSQDGNHMGEEGDVELDDGEDEDVEDRNSPEGVEEDDIALDEITNAPAKPKIARRKRPKLSDPNAPKRPANAFMLFCDLQRENLKEERKELQKSMPGSEQEVALSNLTKALGYRWRILDDSERKHYQDLFKEQVKQYDLELSNYFRSNPGTASAMAHATQYPGQYNGGVLGGDSEACGDGFGDASGDMQAHKKPVNAFHIFCETERDLIKMERKRMKEAGIGADDDGGYVHINKELGLKWRALSDLDRKVYTGKYKELLAAHNEYMEQRAGAAGKKERSGDSPLAQSDDFSKISIDTQADVFQSVTGSGSLTNDVHKTQNQDVASSLSKKGAVVSVPVNGQSSEQPAVMTGDPGASTVTEATPSEVEMISLDEFDADPFRETVAGDEDNTPYDSVDNAIDQDHTVGSKESHARVDDDDDDLGLDEDELDELDNAHMDDDFGGDSSSEKCSVKRGSNSTVMQMDLGQTESEAEADVDDMIEDVDLADLDVE